MKTQPKKRVNARTFNGKPVTDAKTPHVFRVIDKDNDGTGRFDPNNCTSQHALARSFPGSDIAVYEGVTLIEMTPGIITRFRNSPELTKAIKEFQDTGTLPAGVYRLLPVPAHRTLGARSVENAERGDKRKGRVKQPKESTGIANGKPPVVASASRGRPQYDAIAK